MNLRLTAALVFTAVAGLAACGGGGGSSSFTPQLPSSQPSSSAQPTSDPTAPVLTTPAPVSSPTSSAVYSGTLPSVETTNGQTAQAQQGLFLASVAGSLGTIATSAGTFGGLNIPAPTILSTLRKRIATGTATQGCVNGQTISEQSSKSQSTFIVTGYPTNDCTAAPEFELTLYLGQVGSAKTGSPLIGDGLATYYGTSGSSAGELLAYNYLDYVTIDGSNMEIAGHFVSASGTVSSTYGLACQGSACGAGTAINSTVADAAFGAAISAISATGGAPSVKAYVAPLGDIALQALNGNIANDTMPFYGIVQTSGTASTIALSLSSTGYKVVDSTNGAEIDVTVSQTTGAVSGVIIDTGKGKTVADFNVDRYGNGTLTTPSGITIGTIAGFMVV